MVGNFEKKKKPLFMITKEKPFNIDTKWGVVHPKVMRGFKSNMAVHDWQFFEEFNMSDIDKNQDLRCEINETWFAWCNNHKRKYEPIIKEDA